MADEKVVKLNIDLLIPNPYQPRKTFNENSIKELALSIREYGILNPILVRPKEEKYEIIAGERRIRAAKLLNLKEIPAIIKDIDDNKMAEIALIENLQRENITPIEEAITYQTILKNTNKTEKELSEMIGKSQPFIANKIRLLNLPQNIKDALINKKISERHARSLLSIKEEKRQTELLEQIIKEKLTVKELENIIKNYESNELENNSINKEQKDLPIDGKYKEEEKESDNMNNGNFFPNFNNTPDANNQASLNTMNNQTMTNNFTYQPEVAIEQPPIASPTPAMPTVSAIPQMDQMAPEPPIINEAQPVAPILPTEVSTPTPVIPTPEITPAAPVIESQQPISAAPEPPIIENPSPVADIPLFNNPEFNQSAESSALSAVAESPVINDAQVVVPQMAPQEPAIQSVEPAVANMVEPPLFNQNLANQNAETQTPTPEIAPPIETSFEVPVTTETATTAVDKFTKVSELLNANGVEYKAYSNETGYCIIIEL